MKIEQAATRLGMAPREVLAVEDAPAGIIFRLLDGTALIDVPASRPDEDGKTGLMFLVSPHPGYRGVFPVYSQQIPLPVDDDELGEHVTEIDDVTKPRRGRPPKAKE